MITTNLAARGRRHAQVLVTPLAASPLTPNMLTVLGLALSAGTAVVLATGHLRVGGLLLLVASACDTLDGALARVAGRASCFGAFFDSTFDRIAETGIGLGLLVYYAQRGATFALMLLYLALSGSLLVSYARARAEGLQVRCTVGLMTRLERVLLLAGGLVLGPAVLPWVLALLALTTWMTVGQRIAHVGQMLADDAPRADPRHQAP